MTLDLSAVGQELPPTTFTYTDRDVILYALGVGAGADDLSLVYEGHKAGLQVLPTFGVVPAFPALLAIVGLLKFNPMMLVHGEQKLEVHNPIPIKGELTTNAKIAGIYDKKRMASVVIEAETAGPDGTTLFTNTFTAMILGEGGFGGERGPIPEQHNPPNREPDHTIEYQTSPNQAALYRLSGDRNPLHIDPDFAKLAQFDRPILHGLCTFGFVGRAVLEKVCGGDTTQLKGLEVRFAKPVLPGETIVTSIWREGQTAILQAKVAERDETVISHAVATLA